MGAVSSCCAVEDADDRQVMKETVPATKERTHASKTTKKEAKEPKEPRDKAPEVAEAVEPKEEKKPKKQPAPTEPVVPVSTEDINALRVKLQQGMAITVLLQDGTKLSCTLHLNPADNSLSISCEDKFGIICGPFSYLTISGKSYSAKRRKVAAAHARTAQARRDSGKSGRR